MIDFIIQKLTELQIKQFEEDKKNGSPIYVKKINAYKDLIKFFKEEIKNIE